MTQKTHEWDLGFAHEEVLAGLEKLLTAGGYPYTRDGADEETCLSVALPQGSLMLTVRPLPSRSSFNPHIVFRRTLLTITCVGISSQEEETFMQRLLLTFLRVGG